MFVCVVLLDLTGFSTVTLNPLKPSGALEPLSTFTLVWHGLIIEVQVWSEMVYFV